MKNWLVALQNQYNEIKFITNHDDHFSYLSYYNFFSKMNPIYIENPEKFRRTLDEIGRIVLLDMDNGTWERQPIEANIEHTMEELIEYNGLSKVKEEESVTNKDRYKNFITLFTRKNNVLNRNK